MKKQLKILSLPVDRGGCGWYRVRQPLAMIKQHTPHDTGILERDESDGTEMVKALSVADMCIIRQGGEAGIDQLKRIPEFRHLKFVLDIDDNIELISPYSEHYSEYGVREFKDIWVDGKTFSPAKNKARILSLMSGLSKADLVTVTTPLLADYARQFNDNVAVLPNSIDLTKWWPLKLTRHKQLRVGWSGGVSHYEDWYEVKKPLNKLLRKYRFKLVMIGAHFPGVIDEDLHELVEVWPWVPFEAHSYRMMCMGLDIAIIPLADLPFNYFKSAIKFHEFSAMGVPSLVSRVYPYSEEVVHRRNGLLYSDEKTFEYGLEELITESKLRESLGNSALKDVTADHNAAKDAHKWVEAYLSLFA